MTRCHDKGVPLLIALLQALKKDCSQFTLLMIRVLLYWFCIALAINLADGLFSRSVLNKNALEKKPIKAVVTDSLRCRGEEE